MNVQAQCCGVMLLLILLVFYLNQRKLNLITEKAFWMTFVTSFVCIVLDILSVIAIVYRNQLPEFVVSVVCRAYLFSLVSVAASCLYYMYVDVYLAAEKYRIRVILYNLLLVIAFLFIFLLPIKYHYEPEKQELYTYGPAIVATYTFVALFLISLIVIMWRWRKKINPNRTRAVQILLGLWLTAAAIQAVHNKLLLVGYAQCLGIMILYLKMENPEANIDRKTGLFNQNALKLYLEQMYNKGMDFAVLSLSFDRTENQKLSAEERRQDLVALRNYLLRIKDALVFINVDEMIVIWKDTKAAEIWTEKFRDYLEKEWLQKADEHIHPMLVFLPGRGPLKEYKDVYALAHYVKENRLEYTENNFQLIDEEIIHEMYHEKTIIRQITEAMELDRVEVFYQPIYSVKEQRFSSAEALVRIRNEKDELVPPGLFIPIAERNGMIIRLGEMVFEKVCAFLREKQLAQYGIDYIEVNLSMVQCADKHLAERFIQIMEKYHVNPKMINLEITESASMSAKRILLDNMRNLMNYGVKFSLDDFGTGQSNLNYIVDMPVAIVKFDRGMLKAYFENGRASYVMDAAIRMIHGMGLQIVSEGIETEYQYKTMENIGISYIQGYYFSKPLPELEFLQFLYNNLAQGYALAAKSV